MRFHPRIPSPVPPLASALTLLLHALRPAGVTTPSDSWPRIEVCLHSWSAFSFPSIPLWPLTQASLVSRWSCDLLHSSSSIRASISDRGGAVPESRFFIVEIAGLLSVRIASRLTSLDSSRACAMPFSSPSKWVDLVPRYLDPDLSSCRPA